MLLDALRVTPSPKMFSGIRSMPGGAGPLPEGGGWLQWWESFDLSWAVQASWSLGLVRDLAGVEYPAESLVAHQRVERGQLMRHCTRCWCAW